MQGYLLCSKNSLKSSSGQSPVLEAMIGQMTEAMDWLNSCKYFVESMSWGSGWALSLKKLLGAPVLRLASSSKRRSWPKRRQPQRCESKVETVINMNIFASLYIHRINIKD